MPLGGRTSVDIAHTDKHCWGESTSLDSVEDPSVRRVHGVLRQFSDGLILSSKQALPIQVRVWSTVGQEILQRKGR